MQENMQDELDYRIIETEKNNQEDNKMGDKKLTKSASNRMLCGVCAGIGEYLGIDATVVRLLWVLFSVMGGAGLLAYIIAAIIIPEV